MVDRLTDYLEISLNLFSQSTERILWNLWLALIPLLLSLYLFRPTVVRNLIWWTALLIFIIFLPNAPYILTDSIHIIELSQQDYPRWALALVLIPQYTLFILLGFGAYVVSLQNLSSYLSSYFAPQYLIAARAIVHGLCVIGVYIGRFERFNSWDFATRPGMVLLTTVRDLLDGWKLLCMAIAFIVLELLFELVDLVNRRFELQREGTTKTKI